MPQSQSPLSPSRDEALATLQFLFLLVLRVGQQFSAAKIIKSSGLKQMRETQRLRQQFQQEAAGEEEEEELVASFQKSKRLQVELTQNELASVHFLNYACEVPLCSVSPCCIM